MITTDDTQTEERPESASHTTPRLSRRLAAFAILAAVLATAALAVGIRGGIAGRVASKANLAHATEEAAVPFVTVVHPQTGAPLQELVLPGSTQPFSDAPIYARTNGYLKRWYFDIGAHVSRGDLLAEIDTPEIEKQLQQARSELETAQANYHLAETTATRWKTLLQTDSVSRQEADEKAADLTAKKSIADSSASNVRRLEDLQSFQKIYAPFEGVLTARNTDIGALIDAGANAPGRELFHLAATGTLRVFVAIPEVYSRAARSGAQASLTLDEYPGRSFRGTLVRTSNAIDPASRTLLTEIDVQNPSGELLPGAYVSVHLKLPQVIRSVTIPSNTLLFRAEGLRVALVRGDRVQLAAVKLGRDYGNTVEVVSGLQASDTVILDPADSLVSGALVRLNDRGAGGGAK